MAAKKRLTFLISVYLIIALTKFTAAAPNVTVQKQNYNLSITEDYKALRNDAQWFFQHVEYITDTLTHILPTSPKESNSSSSRSLADTKNNATFVENTRLSLLLGLRHLLVGIKEISVAMRQRLSGDHEQQLQHIKSIVQIVQDIIRFAKHWFSLLRHSLTELFRVYNHYIPEIMLCKCFGKYITNTYPDRSFYEYPFILLSEMIEFGVAYMQSLQIYETEQTPPSPPLPIFIPEEEISDEQNEIWPNVMEKYARSLESTPTSEEDVQGSANITEHPWQKCLKSYAADTISRQLKLFFIGD